MLFFYGMNTVKPFFSNSQKILQGLKCSKYAKGPRFEV